MHIQFDPRTTERGSTIFLSIIFIVLIGGFVAPMIISTTSRTRSVRQSVDRQAALYVAEGGLAAAKYELSTDVDVAGDGLGSISTETPAGTHTVTATDLGNGLYQLSAIGVADGYVVGVQEIIRVSEITTFPLAAMTVLSGELDKTKVKIKGKKLILDGGDRPAVVISDDNLYADFSEELAEAIVNGDVSAGDLTGSPMVEIQDGAGNTVEAPIGQTEFGAEFVQEYEGLFDSLVAGSRDLMAGADVREEFAKLTPGTGQALTYGSEDAPVVVHYLDTVHLGKNDTINGWGTLIVSKDLHIHNEATINWVGNVIVVGTDKSKAEVDVHGTLNVVGNLVVLGEGKTHTEFRTHNSSQVNVQGNLMIAGSTDANNPRKARVKAQGNMTVDGLFTVIGAKARVRFGSNSNTLINGMMQVGITGDPGDKTEARLRFEGNNEFHLNTDQIGSAATALHELGTDLNAVPQIEKLLKTKIVTIGWRVLSDDEHSLYYTETVVP